jgi:transposase
VVKQLGREWSYLYAAVEPLTGESVALQASDVNTETMNVFLGMLSGTLGPLDHAVLLMDQAGWHKSRRLHTPDNVTVLYLPPYSPELNPVERLWGRLRRRYLSNRTYADYDDLLAAGAQAWRALTPELLRSLCACPFTTPELER